MMVLGAVFRPVLDFIVEGARVKRPLYPGIGSLLKFMIN